MKALSNFQTLKNRRGEALTILMIVSAVSGLGYLGMRMFGGAKEDIGELKKEKEYLEADVQLRQQITEEKDQYTRDQIPKQRAYEQAVKKTGNGRERAEKTFDLFERKKK